MGKIYKNNIKGFTIVELLVVVVIIGILAAITIVSYGGITQRATEASIVSDLNNNSKLLKMYQVENGSYPLAPLAPGTNCPSNPVSDNNKCLKFSNGNSFTYSVQGSGATQSFTLTVTNGKTTYEITPDTVPRVSAAPLKPTNVRHSKKSGNFYGSITWIVYSYKTLGGVRVYSAASIQALGYSVSPTDKWAADVSWDDMGAEGYVLKVIASSNAGTSYYWNDLGNVKTYSDSGIYTGSGWTSGLPPV